MNPPSTLLVTISAPPPHPFLTAKSGPGLHISSGIRINPGHKTTPTTSFKWAGLQYQLQAKLNLDFHELCTRPYSEPTHTLKIEIRGFFCWYHATLGAWDAIRGQRSAHSLATGPVTVEPKQKQRWYRCMCIADEDTKLDTLAL